MCWRLRAVGPPNDFYSCKRPRVSGNFNTGSLYDRSRIINLWLKTGGIRPKVEKELTSDHYYLYNRVAKVTKYEGSMKRRILVRSIAGQILETSL